MPFGCWTASGQQHLERARNPQAIGGVQSTGSFGIKSFELGTIHLDARLADFAADLWVDWRDRRNAVD